MQTKITMTDMRNRSYRKISRSILLGVLVTLAVAACRNIEPPPVLETVVVTVEGETVIRTVTATPVPTPPPPERSLVICMGEEPDSLYLYGSNKAVAASVLQAIYDGPLDRRSYAFQPVILQKIPDLADGDALLEPVSVAAGDMVVAADGTLTALAAGTRLYPSGCTAEDCVLAYDGESALQMDRLVVTFRLLPGLTWADGTPLTASDSRYSFQLAAAPETPTSKFKIERTASYEAVDEVTVRWTGVPGFMDPTYATNFWTPLPEHLWGGLSPADLLQADISSRTPMGYGPYVIESWEPDKNIRLRRNARYFRADEGLPAVEHLIFRFVGLDPNTSIAQLLSGECDVLDRSTRLDDQAALLQELAEGGQIGFHVQTSLDWEQAAFGIRPLTYDDGFNPLLDRPDFFGDPRTRQAIALCMDRQRVVEEVFMGASLVLDSYLPPGHPLYNDQVMSYSYDPEAGMALLDEVGWLDHDGDPATPRQARGVLDVPNGTPLAFTYLTTQATQRLQAAQILVESMADCGIEASLETLPAGDFYASGPDGPLFGRAFEMGQFAWRLDQEPPCFLFLSDAVPGDPVAEDEAGNQRYRYGWGGWNLTGYSNPDFDAACRQARAALPGQAAYREGHRQAQAIFATDLPVIPLYLHLNLAATRPDLCHFEMDPTAGTDLWNLEAFDYGPSCEP